MDRSDEWSANLVRSPVGCDFLLLSEMYGFAIADLVRFDIFVHLVARAIGDLGIWWPNHNEVVEAVLHQGPRLRTLAQDLLSQLATRHWFREFDNEAQMWVAPFENSAPTSPPVAISVTDTKFDRYLQRPARALITSTRVGTATSLLAGAREGAGDLDGILRPPLSCYQLVVAPSARVFPIDTPEDWRSLCETYPSTEEGGPRGGLLVPNFQKVAQDWDAMHLTFGGLLTAVQVPIHGDKGRTELLGWDAEQTIWLRWAFKDVIQLPDMLAPIASPLVVQ